jgi:ABC-2 type transport system ATP-binding protein
MHAQAGHIAGQASRSGDVRSKAAISRQAAPGLSVRYGRALPGAPGLSDLDERPPRYRKKQSVLLEGFASRFARVTRDEPKPESILSIKQLRKTYASGFEALKSIDLEIYRGEIFALLGPNGAGKTTLINIICGIVNPSSGSVTADGHDVVRDYRGARSKLGLVPQELSTDAFETVWATVTFSRGLFGKPPNPEHLEKVLRELSLWDKKDSKIMALSGGMKRRVLIAKALSHEPRILFLDEPSAGVDVQLRRDMWQMVRGLRDNGVTIILTTHYIEEAEEMADRIGVINKGELVVVESKAALMAKLGKRQLRLELRAPLARIPDALAGLKLELTAGGSALIYTFDTHGEETGIAALLRRLGDSGIDFKNLHTSESSLEDIFVSLVGARS